MPTFFSRWIPCATLTLWSLVLLYYAEAQGRFLQWMNVHTHLFSGRLDAFVIPTFRPMVLTAGVVLLLLALLFALIPANAACCEASDCAHPLSRSYAGRWLSFLILVVPLTVAARFSPDGFSKNTMENRGVITDAASLAPRGNSVSAATPLDLPLPSATAASATPAPAAAPAVTDPKDYLMRAPDGTILAEVLDLLYAAQDPTLRKDFEGKKVQLIGQLMPDTGHGTATRFKAVRMFMTCCAADARPVATLVEAKGDPQLPEMTWIKITGVATFPIENGRRTAILQAQDVVKTEPPPESMLF